MKTSETKYVFSGMISAHAARAKPYCAPYYRQAWHRWTVVEQVTKTGKSAKTGKWETISTTKATSTVRIPFVDSKAYLFGWAKTKAELGTSIAKSSDPRFVQ